MVCVRGFVHYLSFLREFQIKYPINPRKATKTTITITFVAGSISPIEKDGPKATSKNGRYGGKK